MEFIEKSKQIHGEKYDYNKVNYINNKIKVEIVCFIHGSFYQSPFNHISGKGCPDCKFDKLKKINTLSLEEFIEKSIKTHNCKYDYSMVEYKNSRTKVVIICPIHGKFEQLPLNHFRYGCKKCGKQNNISKMTKTNSDFINEADIVHKLKYDYSETIYCGANRKVKIICPIHGMFEQTPNSHLHGRGCKECKRGKNHPRYGKPIYNGSYCGKYKETIFRIIPELFWILECEKNSINFLGLDQEERRTFWQVEINYKNKPSTYCADFYIYDSNEIIEIKPIFQQEILKEKLRQGAIEYEKKGYKFKIINTESIKININHFKNMVNNQIVSLFPASKTRFEKRFCK